MDKLLYVAMTGAKETLRAQAANNHNLANSSTTGFRADLSAFESRAVTGTGFPSRVYATNETTGYDASSGSMQATGRDLDVAVQGAGFIAVQDRNGVEAYTRAGDLRVEPSGLLVNGAGHPIMGDGGPISIPPATSISVAGDGSISIVPLGQEANTTATVARIKLVNPPASTISRGADGLFRSNDGNPAPADASVQVAGATLESSNVNVANAMVTMIELSRNFDLQIKAIHNAEENGAAAAQLLKA
ncbi:MAG: flagellar basal-body rod protein FlgF [Gammaproteobacteria bacterium]